MRDAAIVPDFEKCGRCGADAEEFCSWDPADGWCCRNCGVGDGVSEQGSAANRQELSDEERTVLEVYSRTHAGLVPDAIQAILAAHDAMLGVLEQIAQLDVIVWNADGSIKQQSEAGRLARSVSVGSKQVTRGHTSLRASSHRIATTTTSGRGTTRLSRCRTVAEQAFDRRFA